MILVVDGLTVICLTLAVNFLTRKIPAFAAVILGTVITSLSWLILAFRPTIWGAVFSLFFLALGEIIQAPRYYEYISRLAPAGTAGDVHGICVCADRHRIADRRTVRRISAASLWRSPTSADDDLVLDHRNRASHRSGLWVYDRLFCGETNATA